MKAYQDYSNQIINKFRDYKGRCGVYILRPVSPFNIIINLINVFLNVNKQRSIYIFVNSIIDANELREKLNNIYPDSNINITTNGYKNIIENLCADLVITINLTDNKILNTLNNNPNIKFYFTIFDERNAININTIDRESIIKFINITTPINAIIEESIHSPVEETLVSVAFSSDKDKENYKKMSEYISNTISIFGDFNTINACRIGDKITNRTAIDVCTEIAYNNGWNYEIDASTPFGKELDEIYNPNALNKRAELAYSIMKNRKDLVTDCEDKLQAIAKICMDNLNKKILIVSARGEFAYKVAEYLNNIVVIYDNFVKICGEYHNGIPDTVQKDRNGDIVLVKSGANKGKPKVIGYKKQSTLAQEDFNDNLINVLSIKFSSDYNLAVDCDIVIFTTPIFDDIYKFRRRFQNVYYRTNPFKVYTIYMDGTIENSKINLKESSPIHTIIRDNENIFIAE